MFSKLSWLRKLSIDIAICIRKINNNKSLDQRIGLQTPANGWT